MFPSSHRSSPLKLNIQSKKKNFLTVSLSVLQRFFLDASAALFESAVGLFREGSEGRGVKSGGGHGPELCVWLMDMFEATRLKMVFTALT